MDAAETHIPRFLNPLLDYLSTVLPPTLYDTLETILDHGIAIVVSLFSLGRAVLGSSPSSWDAQVILPPLITLLAAYLALVSFYRTTGWVIRTGFWFVKWGTILSMLAAGAGYMLANAQTNGENGVGGLFYGSGILSAVGGMILGMLNGQGQDGGGGQRSTRSSRTSRSRPKERAPRPKAWESWDRHAEWQYNENARNEGDGDGADVQKVIGDILGAVGRTVNEAGWWEAAKGAAEQFSRGLPGENDGEGPQTGPSRRTQTERKAEAKSR